MSSRPVPPNDTKPPYGYCLPVFIAGEPLLMMKYSYNPIILSLLFIFFLQLSVLGKWNSNYLIKIFRLKSDVQDFFYFNNCFRCALLWSSFSVVTFLFFCEIILIFYFLKLLLLSIQFFFIWWQKEACKLFCKQSKKLFSTIRWIYRLMQPDLIDMTS